jgi:acyl carrier protein
VNTRETIYQILRSILEEQGRSYEIADDSDLQHEGLGFDSLTLAELSSKLEQRFGRDPYTEGVYPNRVGDLVGFYA